ncbi:hypothetical protein IDH50_15870 [Aeromicrobium tamlense]|uniref:Uncharacterized protein n=1 Tax=Aeromicrobium tamlense TaxID=375541 RepID=A0A8I0G1C0_9ACTN|nr:hypothetical protein [Aeromicrobium tamlense]MBD1271722.1 hypothetical protein [Aeromicrobium tamlense]NYI37530.1 hypothetical protein [Aeromicrobium tamlense]
MELPELASELREVLVSAMTDPEDHVRTTALRAAPILYPDSEELATALTRFGEREENAELLSFVLHSAQGLDPKMVDELVQGLSASRSGGPAVPDLIEGSDESELHELARVWAAVHIELFAVLPDSRCADTLRSWYTDPTEHRIQFEAAMSVMRSRLSFERTASERAKFMELVAVAASTLSERLRAPSVDAAVIKAADQLVTELYFASGAYESSSYPERPTDEQRAAWYLQAKPILRAMTSSFHPRTAYDLLQILQSLVDVDPPEVFDAISDCVVGSPALRYETLGVATVVEIVGQYLAFHRATVLHDPIRLNQLRQILETFADAGWPEALHLSYSLNDAFR